MGEEGGFEVFDEGGSGGGGGGGLAEEGFHDWGAWADLEGNVWGFGLLWCDLLR